jgi:hypothetical protein
MIIASLGTKAFEITPHVVDGLEDYFTVDVKGGTWFEGEQRYTADAVSGIGDSDNTYIIITRGAEGSGIAYITATNIAPSEVDMATIRLIGLLEYTTLTADTDEELANPSMEGQDVISDWTQSILEDIYVGGEGGVDYDKSFKMTLSTTTNPNDTLTVSSGSVKRNGPQITIMSEAIDAALYTSQCYVYIELDDTVSPTSGRVMISSIDASSLELVNKNRFILVGMVTSDGTSWTIDKIIHEGDIDDCFVPNYPKSFQMVLQPYMGQVDGDYRYDLRG